MQLANFTKLVAIFTAIATLSGCIEETVTIDAPLRTGSATDERVCLEAVAAQTNNSVSIISSDFSEANTIVMVGVGPERAPWKCLTSDGRVAEIMSINS